MRLVTFESGGSLFALPASGVRSVIPAEEPAVIPGMPAFLAGLISIRGSLVPVVDLQRLLDGEATEVTGESCLVVGRVPGAGGDGERAGGTDVALLVPRLGPSLLLGEERIDASPRVGGVGAVSYVAAVARVDEGLCLVLDLAVLLAGHEGVIERCVEGGAEHGEEGHHGGSGCDIAA